MKINRGLKKTCEYAFIYSIGSILYCLLEILWRGFTHPSMALTGGVCLMCIYADNSRHPHRPVALKCAVGSGIITVLEFISGCVFNKLLRLNVWDYSSFKLNFMGQICLLYSALWFLLSIPAFSICSLIKSKLFCEN